MDRLAHINIFAAPNPLLLKRLGHAIYYLSAEEALRASVVTFTPVPSLTTAQGSHPHRSQPLEDSSFPRY